MSPTDHTPDPRREWVAAITVNGRVFCGPLVRHGTNVRTVASAARRHAKQAGLEREVDSPMLDRWQRDELARRIRSRRAVAEAELQP